MRKIIGRSSTQVIGVSRCDDFVVGDVPDTADFFMHERVVGIRHATPGVQIPAMRSGDGERALFFHSAHLHAHVVCLDHHHNAAWVEGFANRLTDLVSETFLHLETMGEDVDDMRDFRETANESVGQIRHVHFPIEGQHVVLAETVEFDIAHQDHLTLLFREFRAVEHGDRILICARRQGRHGLRHAKRCLEKSFSLRIFSEQ